MRPAVEFKPELASLNMGSMNFGLYPMLARYREFEHDWEREALGEEPRSGRHSEAPRDRPQSVQVQIQAKIQSRARVVMHTS